MESKERKFDGSGSSAPASACMFDKVGEVQFAESGINAEKKRFAITGYSGGIIANHWYWGNVAFDLKGIKFAKKRTPVLEEHQTSKRIGLADKQEVTDKVTFEGSFLSNTDAEKIRSDMKEDFPMEASLYIPPSVIEFVKEGAAVEVNGKTLKGPGAVFRQSTVQEVSICVFGADSDTESRAFSDRDKIIEFKKFRSMTMEQTEIKLTLDQFKSQYPEMNKQIFDAGQATGEKKEREYFAELQKALGSDTELLVKCYSEGKSQTEALKMALDKANAEKTAMTAKMTELQNKASESETAGEKKPVLTPAKQEFSDVQKEKTDAQKDGPKTDEQLKEEFSKSQELQDEYRTVEAYVAFWKADKGGKVRQYGKK